jgi:hypothetical protein
MGIASALPLVDEYLRFRVIEGRRYSTQLAQASWKEHP